MKCENALEMLSPYLDNELSDAEKEELLSHINTCPSCKKELETLEQMIQEWKQIPPVPFPEGLHEDILRTVQKERLQTRRKDWKRYLSAAAAFLVIAAAASGVYEWKTQNRFDTASHASGDTKETATENTPKMQKVRTNPTFPSPETTEEVIETAPEEEKETPSVDFSEETAPLQDDFSYDLSDVSSSLTAADETLPAPQTEVLPTETATITENIPEEETEDMEEKDFVGRAAPRSSGSSDSLGANSSKKEFSLEDTGNADTSEMPATGVLEKATEATSYQVQLSVQNKQKAFEELWAYLQQQNAVLVSPSEGTLQSLEENGNTICFQIPVEQWSQVQNKFDELGEKIEYQQISETSDTDKIDVTLILSETEP